MALLSALATEIAIPLCAVIGIAFSLWQWCLMSRHSDNRNDQGQSSAHQEAVENQPSAHQETVEAVENQPSDHQQAVENQRVRTRKDVSKGVQSFLLTEYQYAGVFVATFAILIFLLLGSVERFSTQSRPCKFNPSNTCKPALVTAVFSTVSFLLGAFTSVVFGSLGTKIAICANAKLPRNTRTALEERNTGTALGERNDALEERNTGTALGERNTGTALEERNTGTALGERNDALEDRNTARRSSRPGAVMGSLLAAIDLLVLYLAINLFKLYYGNDWEGLFEAITGYFLGRSSMALFGRASGGIYAKAADVCVHLVREIVRDRRQAVITNYVGVIVGDIAGMGPDLFGSFAKSSCAALVLASISSFGMEHNFTAMCYPLLISSMGILTCLISTFWWEIRPASKKERLIISTILMTIGIAIVSWIALPSSFTIYNIGLPKVVNKWQLSLCVGVGLWAGQISGFVDIYYTNDDFSSCLQNEAARNSCTFLQYLFPDNFRHGLQVTLENVSVALGSIRIPFFTAVSIFVSYHFAATYGIAVAALGMLSTTATRLAIDASGPISDNAERIARMPRMGFLEATRNTPAAGNTPATPAATGKGFPIESAALVSIALLGAFVNRPAMSSSVDVLTPKVIIGLIMGTWLPYCFSAMTMKSVGRAGVKMALKVCNRIEDQGRSIHATCPEISTEASFRGVIGPTALVIFTPLITGTVFGVEMLSGLLAGSLSSVVQIAISASKTDGAWSQAKVDIMAGALEQATRTLHGGSTLRRAVERGDAIGDPQKDTSGPPLNILIQLMAVESLVFAPFFATHGGLLFKFL